MKTNDYRKIGIALATLLLLAWPVAYLTSQLDGGTVHPLASAHGVSGPNHSGYAVASTEMPCPSPTPTNKSFRMGISLDQAPFAHTATF